MNANPNIFDFLHRSNGISQEKAIDFLVLIIPMELSEFTQHLLSFLQNADEKAIKNLNILAMLLRYSKSLIRTVYRDDLDTYRDVLYKCDLLSELGNIGFETIQKDLNDQHIGIVFGRNLEDILIHQTKEIKKKIIEIKNGFQRVEDEINKIPPITYHVVFSTQNTNEIYSQSFSSLAKAKDFIFKQQDKHNINMTDYANSECDYFVVEIQAEEGSDEFNNATQAISQLNHIPYPQDPAAVNIVWPDSKINSISWVAKRREKKQEIRAEQRSNTTYSLQPVNAERLYNPTGADSVARAIKQLNGMIERLQNPNWVWKIIDALVEAVTRNPGLTNQKIQALTEVKNDVLEHINEIEKNAISLKEVLSEGLEKKVSPTKTIKDILHTHRFFAMRENTDTDDAFDELLNSTRPKHPIQRKKRKIYRSAAFL
ncbi:hypothetical protein DGG96_11040 [Legionella qingyii]|uniref:Uncharacterized protein n=1 Tax=Legionella qingyii TaxID=2184757 RepID=A0A317U579_9GAMM|nr:hypothetical protein [Legionella qingyii]PWY55632.1 hypothetical protein DGG96_11040 [Legionella qingyii]RUR21773.1 hypothetical protein ELY20_11130 [Legionella qingyii]RUR25299.1 hypothetical protein ELY16_10220 [Legionella qingyii]